MANASPEIAQPNETQRAETAANRFYDMGDKARVEEAQYPQEERYKEEKLSGAGRETAQGNFSGAQHILESGAQIWDDNLRGAASEVNRLDQEKRGEKPMSLADAQKAMSGYARGFEEAKVPGGPEPDPKGAAAIDSIVGGTSRPGIEGIDEALKYIESTLQSKANVADFTKKGTEKEFVKDLQEKRAIRDALYEEKQKRVEQMKQSQRGTEELTKGRGSTTRGLEKLYADAGVPEDTASRQEFFGRVGAMSPEELHFLDSALNKAAREAMRSGDPKMLEGLLGDLSTKSFKRKDVEARQKVEDQKKIEEIRRKMGLPEQQTAKSSGMTEEEIEKSRKRIEEMMPSRGPQRMEGAAEPRPPAKEMPKQERETENPFEKLFGSKEITDALDSPKDTRGYTAEQGVAAMTEVFKGLYQNPKQFAARVETLLGQFRSAVEVSKRNKPTVSEEGHRNIANKEVIKGLSQSESKAIDKFLDANYQKMGGKFHRMISTEMPFSDFISFLEGLKK